MLMSPSLPALLVSLPPSFIPPSFPFIPQLPLFCYAKPKGAPRRNRSLQLGEQEEMITLLHSFICSFLYTHTYFRSLTLSRSITPSFILGTLHCTSPMFKALSVWWERGQDTLMNQLHPCCQPFKVEKGKFAQISPI